MGARWRSSRPSAFPSALATPRRKPGPCAQQLGVPFVFLASDAELLFWEWQRKAFPHAVRTVFKQDDLERRAAGSALGLLKYG